MASSLPPHKGYPSPNMLAHVKHVEAGEVVLNEMSAGSSSGMDEAVSVVLAEIDKCIAGGERIVDGSQMVSCLRLLEVLDRPTDKDLLNRWFSSDYALSITWNRSHVEETVRLLHSVCDVQESDAIALVESVKVMRPCVSTFDVACVGRSVIASRPGHWVAWLREGTHGSWDLTITTCPRGA